MVTTLDVMNALKTVVDPEIHRNVVELDMVRDLVVGKDGDVSFTLALTIPACPLRDQISEDARRAVGTLPGVKNVQVTLGAMTDEERNAVLGITPPQVTSHEIGRIIAVMSGKGGGAHGELQVGTIRALLEAGIQPDLIRRNALTPVSENNI